MKKIYLAGPDVFLLNNKEHGNILVRKCFNAGFIGLFPMDNYIPKDAENIAKIIKNKNIKMIKECDIVLANISPFRGAGADNGTTYEIGYAEALNKEIVLYSSNISEYKTRVNNKKQQNDLIDKNNMLVENFNLQDNLMFSVNQHIYETFDLALNSLFIKYKKTYLNNKKGF